MNTGNKEINKIVITNAFFVFAFAILFSSVAYANTYTKMDFGFNGCNVQWGPLHTDVNEAEMVNLATKADANGFTYHPSLRYGKVMVGDYPKGCESPANKSWPLYLRGGSMDGPGYKKVWEKGGCREHFDKPMRQLKNQSVESCAAACKNYSCTMFFVGRDDDTSGRSKWCNMYFLTCTNNGDPTWDAYMPQK